MTASYRFPRGFVWGVATSALQIEGGTTGDGRGESVWDRFSAQPGKVVRGDTPAVACDHFHRYRKDFALMRKLGIRHHRLSVSWSRILPDGRGARNAAGLDFYRRLVDSMLAHGITPWITLYHWELPQALENEGGWRVRRTADAFAGFADLVVQTLGDRVKHWFTLNEIPCFIGLSYKEGRHAPGARESDRVVAQAYHHALLAHGHAVRAVREFGGAGAKVGLAHNPDVAIPVTETPRDIAAAEKWFARRNRALLAPICTGRYPAGYRRAAGSAVQPGDLALISAPTDFLGLNVYSGWFVRAGRGGRPEQIAISPNFPRADLAWINHIPQSIYWAIRHSQSLYGPKSVYITENGAGYEETPDGRGKIEDLHRREYLRNYLIAVQRAAAEGRPVRGYFLWSFIDNFEWAEGYIKRFGIVYNDFATQRRTPKLSARWYAEVMRENRVV